jgi:serine protease
MRWACAISTSEPRKLVLSRPAAWCAAAVAAAIALLAPPLHAATVVAPAVDDSATQHLIVKFRDDATAPRVALAARDRVALLAAEIGVGLSTVRPMALGGHVIALGKALPLAQARAIAARIAAHPDVLYAEPDRRVHALAMSNDPLLPKQRWYLADTAVGINAFGAWDITVGSSSTIVAILDTGYRPHADLAGRILPGYDFVSDVATANDGDGRDADASDPGDWISQADVSGAFRGAGCAVQNSSWHGTGVTSVIAADSNNSMSMAGIDWAAKILPVRVLGKCGGLISDIVDAIAWAGGIGAPGVPANPTPAHVINLSFGGEGACSFAEQNAINQVLAKGVTRAVVVAAGNESGNVSNSDPANCAGVISVAATNMAGNRASYSNFGVGITLSAPGGDFPVANGGVFVLGNLGTTVPGPDTAFPDAGTSNAAPVVSGVISLMLAVAPNMTAAQVRSALLASARAFPAGSTCTTAICGAGIVNALGAVQRAQASSTVNYQGLWWASAGLEAGWGINLTHQGDAIFATWFTYDAGGNAWWLSMTANKVAEGTYTGTLYRTHGPAFNATPFDPSQVTNVPVGTGMLTFPSASSGTFTYAVNGITQSKSIVPQVFGALPTCTWGAQPDLAQATNYEDLWWASPAGIESGWGINLTQQGTTIFATWFTYDVNGNALWYAATMPKTLGETFSGILYRNVGPPFSTVSFSPTQVQGTPVGTAAVSFSNGNSGAFSYDVKDGLNVAKQSKAITRQVFRAPGTVCQ